MKFNSQICTTREQSERLLALGLKKETADMVHIYLNQWDGWYVRPLDADESIHHIEIPAWSLHRLLCMFTAKRKCLLIRSGADLYDVLIDKIEHKIKEGDFPKEYLNGTTED